MIERGRAFKVTELVSLITMKVSIDAKTPSTAEHRKSSLCCEAEAARP